MLGYHCRNLLVQSPAAKAVALLHRNLKNFECDMDTPTLVTGFFSFLQQIHTCSVTGRFGRIFVFFPLLS